MEVSVREAAPLLGKSPRTVRARIADGTLPARRRGQQWMIPLDALPLTTAQRESMQSRAAEIRTAVERALPSRAAVDRKRSRRSVVDFEPFSALLDVMSQDRGDPAQSLPQDVSQPLREALEQLAAACYEFDRRRIAQRLREARGRIARAAAELLLTDGGPHALNVLSRLELEVLPRIGGLLRWAERNRGDSRSAHS